MNERLNQILLIRRELALAVEAAEPYYGTPLWPHMVWHAFEPYMAGGDLKQWIYEIEVILMPALRGHDGGWGLLFQAMIPLVRMLKILNPLPMYGCERCA